MKETLRSKCWDTVSPFINGDVINPGETKEVLNKLHVKIVSDTVDAFGPNRVLNAAPPLVHPSEKSLPRCTRAVLCQLRSGFCSKLNNYRHRIGASDTDQCPDWQSATHSTVHLFNCGSHPTNLTPTDLWERPREAASFLASCPSFNDLPDPGPSPPPPRSRHRQRPPPEPPPP